MPDEVPIITREKVGNTMYELTDGKITGIYSKGVTKTLKQLSLEYPGDWIPSDLTIEDIKRDHNAR